jgi:hypothetical protein
MSIRAKTLVLLLGIPTVVTLAIWVTRLFPEDDYPKARIVFDRCITNSDGRRVIFFSVTNQHSRPMHCWLANMAGNFEDVHQYGPGALAFLRPGAVGRFSEVPWSSQPRRTIIVYWLSTPTFSDSIVRHFPMLARWLPKPKPDKRGPEFFIICGPWISA